MSAATLIDGKRVVICAGSGGVGKTTTSAALALGLAQRGAKVAVVTIDPARRLAGALGLEELGNEPRLIDPGVLDGVELAGELWAMMLDPKRTFDDLIDAVAPSPERATEIKDNRIYRQLSTAVAGSQEFTAVSKLYELSESGRFDVIVLDTPPSRNALDFLDAPARLESFLEGRAMQAFLKPTGIGMRFFQIGTAPLFGALRRVTGIDVLSDLTAFFTLLGGMTDSFRGRARQVDALLHSPDTAFLVITSPQPQPIEEAIWFRRTLEQSGLPFAGAIVNRVHPALVHTDPEATAELPGPLAEKVAATVAEYEVLAARDAEGITHLRAALSVPVLVVPEIDGDVNDVHGLLRMRETLFA
jgi:anion-transporting  ArsA/GET3 family ATPase